MLTKVKARPGHMPYVQEMGIWHQICVSHAYGEGVCPSGMESSLRDSIDGAGFAGVGQEMSNLDGNSTYLVSPDLKSGGAASVILTIFYKPGWSAAQRAAADAKVRALNAANLVVTKVVRNGSARAMAKSAGMTIAADEDADHTIDLQLGGANEPANINGLNYSVNRSMGNTISKAIKGAGLRPGDPVDGVAIMDRPGYTISGDGAAGGGGE
jgi:hypothetical protein